MFTLVNDLLDIISFAGYTSKRYININGYSRTIRQCGIDGSRAGRAARRLGRGSIPDANAGDEAGEFRDASWSIADRHDESTQPAVSG